MVRSIDLLQVKAFARIDGFWLGLVWIGAMWLSLHRPESSWGPLMMMSTPFYIGWRLQSFRNGALDGRISFRRALCFSCYVFFYASLLFALGQWVYLRFLDGGLMLQRVNEAIAMVTPYYLKQGISTQDLDIARKVIEMMSPGNIAFTMMMYNLMIGAFVSPIIALCCKRAK